MRSMRWDEMRWDEMRGDEMRQDEIDGLVQERHNSSALARELRLSSTNPSRWDEIYEMIWGKLQNYRTLHFLSSLKNRMLQQVMNAWDKQVLVFCRRWKWWCWGSRRHNEMIQCSGRRVVDVTGNWLGFAYRQDATLAGVYIIFNDVK